MKRLLYIIIGVILFIPFWVKAETITIEICEQGCPYSSFYDAFLNTLNVSGSNHDVIINLHDETYDLQNLNVDYGDKISSIKINGNNATINVYRHIKIKGVSYAEINDCTINSNQNFDIYSESILVNNCTIRADYGFTLNGIEDIFNLDDINYINERSYLENEFVIKNSTLNSLLGIMAAKANVDNSIINQGILCATSECIFNNNKINSSIMSGFIYPGAAVHIYPNNILPSETKRMISHSDHDMESIFSTAGILSEVNYENTNPDVSEDLTNNIFIYQETSRTVKEDITISSFESEFTNTYIDSVGYDNIKDLPVKWKSQNELIAKVVNGTIIVVKPGSVDIIGRRGNDIYTIHLTIVSNEEGIVEKKEQGTKNYAQADFSSEDLNSIIPLTSDEQAIKESGKNIEVFLEVKDISSNISSEDQKMIDSKLETNEVLGAYLDVSLFKQVEGQDAIKIEETNGNIKVSMKLPDSLLNKDKSKLRMYYILRLHNGVVDKLETELDGDTLTFETNKFSTYALVYEDINNPQTGDNVISFIIMLGTCLATIIMIRKYMYN